MMVGVWLTTNFVIVTHHTYECMYAVAGAQSVKEKTLHNNSNVGGASTGAYTTAKVHTEVFDVE